VLTFNQAQYDDLAIKSQDIYAHTKYDILERFLAGHANLRILNVGCGSGDLSLRLAARGHDVTGIDVEPAYIDLALANAAATTTPGRCRFTVSSIEDYVGAGEFDCVVSTDVLEHIADDRAAFTKMVSLVRPGGLILITVPAGRWLFGYHDEQLGHHRRYNRAMLRNLVSHWCDVRRVRYFGFTLIPVCWLYSRWLRRPYPVAEAADTRQRPVRALVLRALMKIERWLPLPAGTSLLLSGVKK
jgi:SAM-dependent methyltransferase